MRPQAAHASPPGLEFNGSSQSASPRNKWVIRWERLSPFNLGLWLENEHGDIDH